MLTMIGMEGSLPTRVMDTDVGVDGEGRVGSG